VAQTEPPATTASSLGTASPPHDHTITLRYDSRLHHIGRRPAGQRVLILAHDLNVRVLTEHGELVRQLTIDPTRDCQPINNT